jgi:eukaryotic-like serine/threonine-protein kinase
MAIEPGQRLGHYDVSTLIGRGGMGAVYIAHDTRLGRDVALKVLLDKAARTDDRLLALEREAKVLASLNHPNVCTVHEIGEHDGHVFIVMEYVAGQPLSELIPAGGFPLARVIGFGLQIADAVAHAHVRNVVHRDLTSRNVIVTPEGHLKVLDFGLATVVRPSADWAARTATATRPPLASDHNRDIAGTLPYMAPEVLRGEGADQRSDVWGIGVLLYEMATGARPFKGRSAVDLTAAIVRDALPADTRWPSVSLRRMIERCLSKSAGERYQTAAELRAALQLVDPVERATEARERPARRRAARAAAAAASIAVLPFANLTADPDQAYFCDGIAEDIITRLTKVPALHVASRTSAFRFRGGIADLASVRRQLRVKTLLSGSIRRSGDRLRVTATLVDTSNGYQLWSEQFDRQMDDVFAIQDEISTAIADRLRVQLGDRTDAASTGSPTVNLEAYRLCLRGRFHFNKRQPELLQSAIESFERAIVADPQYAPAYAGLADTYTLLAIHGPYPPHAVFPKASRAAARALELDPTLGAAHASIGFTKASYEWDWPGAEHHFLRAIELNPGDSNARHWYAIDCLAPHGRLDEALDHLQRSVALDPLSVSINTSLGGLLHDRREYSRAIEQYLSTIELEPSFYFSHWNLGRTYEQIGEYDKAMRAFERALALAPSSPTALAYIARCHAHLGRPDEARRLLAQLLERRSQQFIHATGPAMICLALNDFDRAFELLEAACDERSIWLIWMKITPAFDAIRSDSRFQELLRRVHLAD